MYQNLCKFRPEEVLDIFVLNAVNVSKENEKLMRMMCKILKWTVIKKIDDNSSTEYKTVPAIKEEVETVNFNQYWSSKEQNTYRWFGLVV